MSEYPRWLLNGEPFKVQSISDQKAGFQRGYNWWLEQGLGKTAVALQNFMRWRTRTDGAPAQRLIVVTLNSMRLAWKAEIERWIPEKLSIEVWPDKPQANPDVFIVNYESLAGQGRGWGRGYDRASELANSAPTMLVVDEGHRIKTPGSRWSKSVLGLAKDCVARRGLTGTPMSQSVMDLYPQLKLAGQLNGLNQFVFRNRYALRGGHMGKQIVGINQARLPELNQILDECSFRALKSEWTDLPPKMPPVVIPLEMPKELEPAYRSMMTEFLVEVESRAPDDPILARLVVTQMGKLQQISSGFIYDEYKEAHTLVPLNKLPKYRALLDLLDGLGESKLLVFCHFRPTSKYLVEELSTLPGGCAFLVGGMTIEEMEAQKSRFNQDGGPRVLVAQVSVGSAGHTLLGGPNQPCYTTAFFENNFVLVDREQSMDRNHRYGQKSPVSYYDFVSSEIEKHVLKALHDKKSLVQAVIDHRNTLKK